MKNTTALTVGRVSVPLFSFVLVIYAARYLGTSDFGKYALVLTYFQLFLGLCVTGLSILITREIARKPKWVSRYLSSSIIFTSVLALVSSGILLLLSYVFNYTSDTKLAIFISSITLLPAASSIMFESAFVAFERAEYVTYGLILENILRVALSLIAIFAGYRVIALFVVLLCTRTVLQIFYFVLMNRYISKLNWYFEWDFLKDLARNWTTFAAESWCFSIFYSLDVVIISLLHGEHLVGLYAAAYKMLNPSSVVASSFTSAIFPYMSRLFEESKVTFQKINLQVMKYILVIILPGIISISYLADWLIVLLYSDLYIDSIPVLKVLIWVVVPIFLNPYLSHILFARGEQRKALLVAVLTLVFYIPITFWFISQWAAIGAAWAFLTALSVAFGLYFVIVLGVKGAVQTLLNFGRIAFAAACSALLITALKDIHPVPLLGSALVLYTLLLLLFRVPSPRDIGFIREMAGRGIHQVGKIMGRVCF